MLRVLTGLVGLFDCFFNSNSLVVVIPCSLIFWHFGLLIEFRLVIILLLVLRGKEGFLPMPPSWLELKKPFFKFKITAFNLEWKSEGQEKII